VIEVLRTQNNGILLSEEIKGILKNISTEVIARCKNLSPDECQCTQLLEEEQEKELKNELEEEKEPDPPREATPNLHLLHSTVLRVIQSGTVSNTG
jgi:hypothetical protein